MNAADLRAGLIDGIRGRARGRAGRPRRPRRGRPRCAGSRRRLVAEGRPGASDRVEGSDRRAARALCASAMSEPIAVETDEANAEIPRRACRVDLGQRPRRRRCDDRRAGRRDRGSERRDPRPRPDRRHDHGQRLRAHAHPPDPDRRGGRASSRGPSSSPTRSTRSSTAAAGPRGRRPTRATTWPASTRSAATSTSPAPSFARRCPGRRSCAASRRPTTT